MPNESCPHCGASMKAYWHRLTPGLVSTLIKIYNRVQQKNENKVSKKELSLTHSEYGNFQKLRFHGLIARYRPEGHWDRATWLITRRGGQFLRGEIEVPVRVRTFRNKVTGHDEQTANIGKIWGSEPYWDQKFSFEFVDLYDDGEYVPGPPVKKRSRKKGPPVCPNDGTVLRKNMLTEPVRDPVTGTEAVRIVKEWRYCTKCGYKEDL